MKYLFLTSLLFATAATFAQTADFRSVVEKRLKPAKLVNICDIDRDSGQRRIFKEYGAIFLASGVKLPTACIFDTESAVATFQNSASPITKTIGGTRVTLQPAAMKALDDAIAEAASKRFRITPRGGSIASMRGFKNTLDLWNGRFISGLAYWTKKGRISKRDADAARSLGTKAQVARVLAWEEDGIFFSTGKDKSILFSVAAPGASQHIFGLALDVEQFSNPRVREIMARHGWFQTVKSDAPHFTYLGVEEDFLPSLGLRSEIVGGQKFWIPDFD